MAKDWNGNKNSLYITLGASNHTDKERQEDDFYATDPIAIDKLFKAVKFAPDYHFWECACGQGHLSERIKSYGYDVYSTDLVDRGYGTTGIDFLKTTEIPYNGDNVAILTNPPYKYHKEFIRHALDILPETAPAIFLLKTTALEGKARYDEFYKKGYLKYIFQFSERLLCAKNAKFDEMKAGGGSAVSYAWFWFCKSNTDDTIIRWI